MYPGIYQPLQPLSVLLTDLLRYPHSDEAILSRGLVDAIFDLYRVDHGVVSRTLSPLRSLSDSGKDAWWILIRARTRALESIGQDPHILLPYRVRNDQKCMCGNLARVIPDPISEVEPSFDSSFFDLPARNEDNDPSQLGEAATGISWDEWDALFGDGTGFLA